MGHVPMCAWCGCWEVGSHGPSADYCSEECELEAEREMWAEEVVERNHAEEYPEDASVPEGELPYYDDWRWEEYHPSFDE